MNIIKTLSIGLIVGLLGLTNYSTAYAVFITTVGPNINVSAAPGNQAEATIAVDPTNPQRIFVASNPGSTAALSTDGGATWTRFRIGTGTGTGGDGLPVSCCDNVAVFDQFGNLFLVYLSVGADGSVGTLDDTVELAISTTGGGAGSFTILQQIDMGRVDQPTVAVGPGTGAGTGSVWVTWNRSGTIFARGASVTALGTVGAFNAAQAAPNSLVVRGQFGDIAIGPAGQVMVTYQSDTQIFVNTDADGLGAAGFGTQVTATNTNVDKFDAIPAQDTRTIDAEAGLVYDRSGGANNGRVYLVYTDEVPDEGNDTDILVRFSNNNGTTWSAPVRVNDDTTTNSQFLPHIALDQTTGSLAVTWYDTRNDSGAGAGTTNIVANDDAQFWGTFSTTGGATFMPNFQISAGTSNEDAAASGVDYADYSWADSAFFSGGLYPVWSDNSNSTGDNPNGALSSFDLYTARVTLVNNLPPSVNAGADVSGDEGAVIPLVGTASDPNGDPLTTTWTFTPGAGVDAGAMCAFADSTAVDTTITCTDDGTYTATLTVSDGVNPPVSDDVVVTVNNVAPTVNITAPSAGDIFLLNAPVNLTATFADAGTNDTHTCTIDWGDGSSTTGAVVESAGTGTCTDSHTYRTVGKYTIQVTITDDDDGASTTSVTIHIRRGGDDDDHDNDHKGDDNKDDNKGDRDD